MTCIFQKSKYYAKAHANPLDVAEPLGYKFLYYGASKPQALSGKAGELVIKYVYDKGNHQMLSPRRTPFDRLEEFFKISELPRKNDYISTHILQFIQKEITPEIVEVLCSKFMPNAKEEFSMVEIAHVINNPRIDSLLYIQDYTLSKHFFFCEGSNQHKINFIYQLLNRRIIEYPVQIQLADRNNIAQKLEGTVQNFQYFQPPTNITSLEQVKQFIQNIQTVNKNKDPLYAGVHIYFADFAKPPPPGCDYFKREVEHLQSLQYYITVLTGILADGQTAILKLNGSLRHKTFEYLFILKLIFSKVSLNKTYGSNPFTPDSYVCCEYYSKKNGDFVHQQLLDNYDLLKQQGEEKLLIDPKKIFKDDMHSKLSIFNDRIIFMGLQQCLKEFKINSNVEFYPNKNKIKDRIPTKYCIDLEDLIETIKEETEDKTNVKKQVKKIEKEADFNMLSGFGKRPKAKSETKTPDPKKQQPKKQEEFGKTPAEKLLDEIEKMQEEKKKLKKKKKKEE